MCPYCITETSHASLCVVSVCMDGGLCMCFWYVLHWLSQSTMEPRAIETELRQGTVWGEQRGSGRDIPSRPVTSHQQGQEIGEFGRVQQVTSVLRLGLWVFQLGKLDRNRPPSHPTHTNTPIRPTASSLSLVHSSTLSCVCPSAALADSHNAMCFLVLYLNASFMCVYLCVCLLLIRSLWPPFSAFKHWRTPAGSHVYTYAHRTCLILE